MGDHDVDVASAMAEAARAMHRPRSLEQALEAIVQVAATTVPGMNHAGISLARRGGTADTMAATDPVVWKLDSLQYELDEGPCVDALRSGTTVVVEDLRRERRWPRYVPHAVELGARSQIGLRLFEEAKSLGALNLYSTVSDTVTTEALQLAELFATHASLALGRARKERDLTTALETRKTIGQAIGLVMERYQVSEERAFEFLVRLSSTSNIKLRDIAEELVMQVNDKAPPEGRP